jgi:transcriptional regulator with XRE-family HTH domain
MKRELMANLRHDQGLTMDQAAERAGISESYWSYIESGKALPSLITAGRIARVLGATPTKLFTEFAQAVGEGA